MQFEDQSYNMADVIEQPHTLTYVPITKGITLAILYQICQQYEKLQPQQLERLKKWNSGFFQVIYQGDSVLNIVLLLVMQQVYMYFRGSGKAAELRREVARGAVRAAV